MNETSGFVNVEFPFKDVDLVLDRDLEESCNSSGEVTPVNTFYFYEYEQLATLWVLFGSIVIGNSAVLISLFFDKRRSSRFNYFIKHLALADLSVGFVSVLTDIIWKMTIEWNAGNFACKVIRYSQAVVTYSSTYLLVALTIDRCEAIRHPMNFFKSWRRAKLLVVTAWILSVFFSIPLLVLYEQKIVQNRVQCWIELFQPWQWQVYMILISLTVFFIPALIIVVCYSVIIFTIWSNSNVADSKNGKNSASSTVFVNEDVNCKRVSSRGLIPKAKVKTIKMTLIIVSVFIICWGPYVVFDLLQVFGYVKRTQKNIAVATFIQSLAPLNSAANPIIYCIFSSYICRNPRSSPFLQYICKCCCRSKVGVKVSDATTSTVITHASSGRCINFHHLVRLDNLSNADKNLLRGKGTSLNTGAEG